MFHTSLAKALSAMVAVLAGALLAVAGALLVLALLRFSDAGRVTHLVHTDRAIFDAIVTIRAQLGRSQTALLTVAAPDAVIEEGRANAEAGYRQAMDAIAEADLIDRPALMRAVGDAWTTSTFLRPLVDEQAIRPIGARDLDAVRPWREAELDVHWALDAAAVAVGNEIRRADPIVAEMALVRREAWIIRDAYGNQCSLLRPFVAADRPLDAGTRAAWTAMVGSYGSAWLLLDAYALRPRFEPRLGEALDRARAATHEAQARIDAIVGRLGAAKRQAVGGEEWTRLCNAPFDDIVTVGRMALDEAEARAKRLRRDAALTLFGVSAALLPLMALAVFAVRMVRRRFSRPIAGIVEAIADMSQNRCDRPLPNPPYPDELGEVGHALHLLQETMRRNAELERQLADEKALEREARVAAEAANRAKSVFLANMSHELRTPLNAILGFGQLLAVDARMPADLQRSMAIIRSSGEHLLGLIDDILDMAKIESGRLVLAEDDAELIRLIDDVTEMMRQRAEARGLRFALETDPDLPRFVRADAPKLRQVLINLIGNAIKYTDAGGLDVRFAVRGVAPDDEGARHDIVIEVADSGRGIAAEDLEAIFEPFVQASRGRGASEGTGLGLAITRQFVRLMGGDVQVQSTPGEGSVFTVELSLREGRPLVDEAALPRVVGLVAGQPDYRILVADDSAANRELLIQQLQRIGILARGAVNGREAVAVAERWQPHLIWMDVRMPEMGGVEATEAIKASPWGAGIVIIGLTTSSMPEEAARMLAAGCVEILRKPYRERDLFAAMARWVGIEYRTDQPPAPEDDDAALFREVSALDAAARRDLKDAFASGEPARIARAVAAVARERGEFGNALRAAARQFRYRAVLDALALAGDCAVRA